MTHFDRRPKMINLRGVNGDTQEIRGVTAEHEGFEVGLAVINDEEGYKIITIDIDYGVAIGEQNLGPMGFFILGGEEDTLNLFERVFDDLKEYLNKKGVKKTHDELIAKLERDGITEKVERPALANHTYNG